MTPKEIADARWEADALVYYPYFYPLENEALTRYLNGHIKGGLNLDIGSGWNSHYPNSICLDGSIAMLRSNMQNKRVRFDLTELSEDGISLPFEDSTFDSATMISVWQYNGIPRKKLVQELIRVLKPDSEFYLINSQGEGWYDLIDNDQAYSENIARHIGSMGLDWLIEEIPVFGYGGVLRSVCVATPMGRKQQTRSKIRDKNQRIREKKEILIKFPVYVPTPRKPF